MALLLLLALLMVGVAAAPPARAADAGPCTGEDDAPSCRFSFGEVTFVADGDTIDVRIPGVGSRRVRVTGINAMEMTRFSRQPARRRGACHALEATGRLEGLLEQGGGRVRLAAQDPDSVTGGRLRRQVSTRIGGSWVDVGRVLVAEGLALWLPNGVEYAWNRTYKRLSEQAAARRRGLFDADACGRGPAPAVRPELELRWDAPGDDRLRPDGEWARIGNPSPRPLHLGGWWFRDSSARRFTFPAGSVVPPDGSVTLHVGRGDGDERDLYWGLPAPAFENPSGGRRAMGDGGYLFDPRGNLRAWAIYPGPGDTWVGLRRRTVVEGVAVVAVLLTAALALLRRARS